MSSNVRNAENLMSYALNPRNVAKCTTTLVACNKMPHVTIKLII